MRVSNEPELDGMVKTNTSSRLTIQKGRTGECHTNILCSPTDDCHSKQKPATKHAMSARELPVMVVSTAVMIAKLIPLAMRKTLATDLVTPVQGKTHCPKAVLEKQHELGPTAIGS